MAQFPSIKARKLLRVLEGLGYSEVRKRGSHRVMAADGLPQIVFAFHDGDSLAPGLVRKVLTKEVGLTEEEALDLL